MTDTNSKEITNEELIAWTKDKMIRGKTYVTHELEENALLLAHRLEAKEEEIMDLKSTLSRAGWTKMEGAQAWKPPVNTKVRDLHIENSNLSSQIKELEEQLKE